MEQDAADPIMWWALFTCGMIATVLFMYCITKRGGDHE